MEKHVWSRDELIIAFNLYCKTPFTKINSSNRAVKELAPIIGRSASAVALKLANFARLDPALQERNISGMSHGSKEESVIWNEFNGNWEELAYQSEQILARLKNDTIENTTDIIKEDLPAEGRERESVVRIRVNQYFFRKTILASYDNRCCITGISLPELLVASHIVPWAVDKKNRMNPRNGLCLNALHDRAFDTGLITITPDYTVRISDNLRKKHSIIDSFFTFYENKRIMLPQRFLPSIEFIEYHNKYVFLDRGAEHGRVTGGYHPPMNSDAT
jgi:putative restriction endonuclease